MKKTVKNAAKSALFLLLALLLLTPHAYSRDASIAARRYVEEKICAVLGWIA